MATFCRITGKSRGLPKPNYFPLLPPISPADAKRFCKITGKSYGLPSHHYIPVLVGKPKKNKKTQKPHVILANYKYYFPCLEASTVLIELLDTKKPEEQAKYAYTVRERKCGLVFTAELEAAVRDGDVRDVMLGSDADIVLLKLKKGQDVSVEVKEMDIYSVDGKLYDGMGVAHSAPTKKKMNDCMVKIFEDKEKASEEKVKVSKIKPKKPSLRNWKNAEITQDLNFASTVEFEPWKWQEFGEKGGELCVPPIPVPVKVEPKLIDLRTSLPGIVQGPVEAEDLAVLDMVPVMSPFKPLLVEPKATIQEAIRLLDHESLSKTCNTNVLFHEKPDLLPSLQDIPKLAENLKTGIEVIEVLEGLQVHGLKLDIEGVTKFVAGQKIETEEGLTFIAGQTIATYEGESFVPGFTVSTSEGPKLLPGHVVEVQDRNVFLAGQTVLTRDGEKFVQGQNILTKDGMKFVTGQTIYTEGGPKFVAGQVVEERFVPGQTISTSEGPQFVCGQTVQTQNGVEFIGGQSVWSEKGWDFVPGKVITVETDTKFVPGKTIINEVGEELFIPGQFAEDDDGNKTFVPGVVVENNGTQKFICGTTVETPEGPRFVEGRVINRKFIPGQTNIEDGELVFSKANTTEELSLKDAEQGILVEPIEICSVTVDTDGVYGHMVHSSHGVEFFPGAAAALPAGKTVPGRLIRGKEVIFVPGLMIDGSFVPGQVVMTDTGDEFVPGQVVETAEGPKFVPGQIIQTKTGQKFVPGQTVQTEDGPKFVPGQIVETQSGPTFIPGQVIHTDDEGLKFVPGQVVDTIEGPRFVPGRVVESGEHVVFIPGQIVETSEGLRFVAPDLEGDDGNTEFTVQGFEVSPEELRLLRPKTKSGPDAADVREMSIDSKMMKQLSKAGMAVGRQVPTEIPAVDIYSTSAMKTACSVAKNLKLDPVSTAKVGQLLVAVEQLGKLGEIKGNSEEIRTLNGILERVVHCKNETDMYKIVANIIEKDLGVNAIDKIDKLHAYVISQESPLKRLNKVNILKEIVNYEVQPEEVVTKLSTVLNEEDEMVSSALRNLSECNPEIVDMIMQRVVETMGEVESEKEAVETIHRAVVATVREASEMSIVDLLKDTESLGLKELILEAVGLAKALDMTETAIGLLDILSNPKCTDILAGDRVTLEILRRLTVMKQLAQKRPELLSALKNMQADPYGARTDPSLKQLVRESGALLVVPEEGISLEAVPTSLMFSQNSLAMEEFLTRTKRTFPILVIIKNGIQAIIPREASHSVLTGSVPYAVLDEKGLHQFKPKHVFSALRLPKLCTHWFSMYMCEIREDIGNISEGKVVE